MIAVKWWARSGLNLERHVVLSSVLDYDEDCADVGLHLRHVPVLLLAHCVRCGAIALVSEDRVVRMQTDEIGLDANGTDY